MSKSISIRPLNSNSPELQQAVELYIEAFPSCERRDTNEWLDCLSIVPNNPYVLFGIYLSQDFIGFISCWIFNTFVYAEHFAVKQTARGNGIGASTISLVKEHFGNTPIVLEAEPPYDEMSKRRIGFYQRQGFVIDTTPYLQPPYRKEDNWFELKLMSTHPDFVISNHEMVKQTIYRYVYHVEEDKSNS